MKKNPKTFFDIITDKEIKDVAKSTKEVINQAGDVVDAAKGKKRRGRKPKAKK